MKLKNIGLAVAISAISTGAFAQKKIETSAAIENNKFKTAIMTGDKDGAKKALLTAKKYIDEAAVHPDTKESPKTLYLVGDIYSNAFQYMMMSQDTSIMAEFGENSFEKSIENYKKSYESSKKYRPDITESVDMKINMLSPMSYKLYEEKMYAEAGEAYYVLYQLSTAKGALDSTSLYYSAICFDNAEKYENAANSYVILSEADFRGGFAYAQAGSMYAKAKKYDDAKAILEKGREKYGLDKDILLEMVRVNIAQGDNEGAEKALNNAIAKDPNNKQLHYIIGTIYTELGKNEAAEASLNKALELDPDYLDAMYNLGAHLVTWGKTLNDKAKQMEFGDPELPRTEAKADEILKRALIPLENYISKVPNDVNVLQILYQLHYNLGNSEKAVEYKKRYEAAKAQ